MGLFKRAHVNGINHALISKGLIAYPNGKIAEEVADAVADDLEDTEIPEVTDETGLTAEEASTVITKLVDVAEEIAEKTGGARDIGVNKVASDTPLETAAYIHASRLIEKAAAEVKLAATVPRAEGGAEVDLSATTEAEADAKNNPSAAVIVPKGKSSVDATPGNVGHQEVRQDQTGIQQDSPPATIADVKIAELLRKLSAAAVSTGKKDGAGAPGSQGGTSTSGDGSLPVGGGRADTMTNAAMGKDMIVAQGQTDQATPNVPVPLEQNVAAKTVVKQDKPNNDVQEDVKKAASLLMSTPGGREVLAQLDSQQQEKAAEHNNAANVLLRALSNVAVAAQ
jgi:hypothetical protein